MLISDMLTIHDSSQHGSEDESGATTIHQEENDYYTLHTTQEEEESKLMDVVLKANQACEDGMFLQAIHLYTEGLRREPSNAMVFSNRSAAFLHSNDFRNALNDAEKAIRLQPTWSKGYLRKGLALQHMRDFEGSVTTLAQGLAYETQSRQILAAIVESILLSNLRDTFDSTQKQLRKLGLDQNPFVMLSAIGQELLSAGRFKTALSVLNSALQVGTDNLRLKGSLMSALASAHWKLGNLKQAISYMKEDLTICRSLGDQHGECRVIGNLGNASHTTKQYEPAIQYYKDQLLLATDIKSRKTAGFALGSLGHTYSAIGEHDQALACHEQCVALAQEMGNKLAEAEEYGNIGCLHLAKGDHTSALQFHEQHLTFAQELDNLPLQTKAYFNMGTLYQQIHDYSEALKCYQEILTFGVKMRDRSVEMRAYAGLGGCSRQIGELTTALNYYQQYLSIALKLPDNTAISKAYCCLGNINQALGRLPEALDCHKNHLVKVLELRDRVAEGRVYGNLGNVHCAMGHYNKAVKLHEQALGIAIEEGDTISQASTNGNLGIAYQGLGENNLALKHLDAHLTISRECVDREGQLKALSNLGNFHANKADFPTAHDLFQEQLEISQDKGDVEAQCKSLNSIGMLYKLQGKVHMSLNCAQQAVTLSTNRPKLLVKNLVVLAKLYLVRGQHNDARGALQRAYDTTTQRDTHHCQVLNELATASLLCGYVNTALNLYSKLSDVAQDQQLFNFEMISLAGYGKIHLHNGAYNTAKEYFESAISICKDKRLIKDEFYQHLNISRVFCALRQYEDAHSALVSAKELLPRKQGHDHETGAARKPNPTQEDRNLLSELSCGFGDLSLAKGDYADALEHYKEQRRLLVGEEQLLQTSNMVLCLWLLGSGYQAVKILDTLEDNTLDESPYLMSALLATRAKLYTNVGRFSDTIHQHEVRLDSMRRQGDRVSELCVLNDLANAYLLEGHCNQALVNFDQGLMISRDIGHVLGECGALLGLAKSYFQMFEYETCLTMCDEVEQINGAYSELTCQSELLRARSHLQLGDIQQSIKHSRQCVEHATYYPFILATATAILGHGLVQGHDEMGGHEAIISSCSQFEIILLQKNIDFIYELVSPVQELSYTLLFDLQPKPADNIWIHERILRWERARYLAPSSPFPALHTSTQSLADICSVLGEGSVCVVVRVDQRTVHTWYLSSGQGLSDYYRTDIPDRTDFLESEDAGEVMFGCVVGDVKRLLQDTGVLYVVMSEDVLSQTLVDQLKFEYFPKTPVSVCGCLDDIGRFVHDRCTERSLAPTVLVSHEQLRLVCSNIQGKVSTKFEELNSYHMIHISCEMISYSDLNPDLIFIGDLAADCLFLHNTGDVLYEDMSRLSLALLSNIGCIVTQLAVCQGSDHFYQQLHTSLLQGSSILQAVSGASKLLAEPATIQCYGCDWTPRQPNHVAGVRLLLRSAEEDMCSAVRATLEIIDKIKTGFNREGAMLIQYDILQELTGWDEILHSLGAAVQLDKVMFDKEGGTETEEIRTLLEEIRTLLTSLLDCGDQLCGQIVRLLLNNDINTVVQIVDLLELYVSTTPDNSASPRLPLPSDVFHNTSTLLQAIGLCDTGQLVNGNVLLAISHETSFLRVEAALFLLKTLFDLGSATQPYYSPADDVGAIEI